jgi:GntR family transcriptional regulator of arabinose operon
MSGQKHVEIREYLLSRIRRGLLRPGDKAPSEYELARRFNVNKTTANKAVAMLVSEGFLERRKGAGTFVVNEFATVTPAIGIYTNLKSGSYFPQLLIGVEEEAYARGYSVTFLQFPGWGAEFDADRFWKYVASTGIKGLIINRPFQKPLTNIPTLFLDTAAPAADVDQVQVDNEEGGRLLAKHFLDMGHKHVAFVSQDPSREDLVARARGFLGAFEKRGLGKRSHDLHSFSPAQHNLPTVLRRLLLTNAELTGIGFDSDHVAHRAIEILQKLPKAKCEQISVAGFGNVAPTGFPYKLTSIEQHPLTLGHLAASTLIDRIEGRTKHPARVLAPVELFPGDTVRRINA